MSLKIENLTIYYQTIAGNVRALEDASFSLADGEIMGVAGESGCGKSTLSNSLIYLHAPMKYIRGRVFLDGEELPIHDTQKMNPFRYKKISVIPQYAMNAMNPTKKIGRMVEDLLKSRGENYKEILPEVKNRLELVKLSPDVLNMYPFELSGGMKQRMVMVISTLLDPSLLLADEVTSALDVSSQKAVAEMLVGFRDKKIVKSIMLITHDISILYQTANTIMVMYAGQLAEKASTETIIKAPRHPYTKLLISSLPTVGVRISENRLAGIPGNPPLLLNPPTGCRFRDRCPVAFAKCAEVPPFVEIEKGHFLACWKEGKAHA
ncbi:ABC transporter ATP-binding protein [Leptolinea tardivitalis]|uniref:Peptide ABC transporter ATPase n=1 Tax=Leptolinea tardivitalis TaxID=229920 RepID=A0A0P6X8K0_9CHLR|nr:ABC transporter ATP-binding protein [Leptolinea tardivitalis]KPL70565.1 peptide ABC transporter ATPase [Leptolinea tardivitalis]GAP22173.1 oligopeptide/dipeptide ABC transporter, ATP-binding protein, C-terminal domain [Leptolinea tardivitalis]